MEYKTNCLQIHEIISLMENGYECEDIKECDEYLTICMVNKRDKSEEPETRIFDMEKI